MIVLLIFFGIITGLIAAAIGVAIRDQFSYVLCVTVTIVSILFDLIAGDQIYDENGYRWGPVFLILMTLHAIGLGILALLIWAAKKDSR